MPYIFDGKTYASKKELLLAGKVVDLKGKGVTPLLVSIIIGNDPASHLYVGLKKKAGERVGIVVDIKVLDETADKQSVINLIGTLNSDEKVHGIMVQLPLPKRFSQRDKTEIINSIAPEKDVDGLGEESRFLHPTSKAVIEILELARSMVRPLQVKEILLVGATGMVGKPLAVKLKDNNYKLIEADSETTGLSHYTANADVVISATGVENLIKAGGIKKGAILIDVGSPRGDIERLAYEKASFVSPVPRGVGPVTITCLLENLIDAINER